MPNATSSFDWRLYVILDRAAAGRRDLAELAEQAIRGGADVLQLRDKTSSAQLLIEEAKRILVVTKPIGVPLLINDHVDVALASGADGVHLGQDDMPPAQARKLLGPGRLIGQSTHSLEQARAAMAEPVDYLAVGPVYATPTKPDYGFVGLDLVRQVTAEATKPVVVIGGIDLERLPEVLAAGARCVAVVRAVCADSDPEQAARSLKHLLQQFVRTTR